MNATPFLRILWKEYRTQRAGWICIAFAIVSIDLALLANPWISHRDVVQALFAVALVLAALYTLGSAVTLFATERENGTYDVLRALPVGPWTVFFGKTAFTIVSAAAMFVFAWTLALTLAGGLPHEPAVRQIWAGSGLMAVGFLLWGILFSLLFRRTVVAACLAGTVTAIIMSWLSETSRTWMESFFILLALAALVTAAIFFLANRWLRETLLHPRVRVRSASRRQRPVSVRALGRLWRLVWQETRQSFVLTVVILATVLPIALYVWLEWLVPRVFYDPNPHWAQSNSVFPIFVTLIVAGYCSPVLLGSTVFLGDQTGYHFRFLAERGFPPRFVWLSRHIRGVAVMLLGILLFPPPIIVFVVLYAGRSPAQSDDMILVESLLGYVAVAYACGQLCSMAIRSGILAAAAGAILTFVICAWAWVMSKYGMSWSWTVAPLPVAFLAATWLHAPNWLVERKTWRARLRPALVVAIPALAIIAAIPLVRIYEIPWVEPGFDTKGKTWSVPPEEKKALVLYAKASELLQKAKSVDETRDGGRARREAEAAAVALAMEAVRYPLPGFCPDVPDASNYLAELGVAGAVLDSGEALQSEGWLDAALDRYLAAEHILLHFRQLWPGSSGSSKTEVRLCEDLVNWGAQNGQSSQRVLKAMQAFEKLWRTPSTTCDEVEYVYLQDLHILKGDQPGFVRAQNVAQWSDFLRLARWMPWERVRALRILNLLTAERIARCRSAEQVLAGEARVLPPLAAEGSRPFSGDKVTYSMVLRNMPADSLYDLTMIENCRRAARLVLALEAWRLDHGSLPASLDQLKGKYIDQVPIDLQTREKFGYEPKGLPQYLEWYTQADDGKRQRVIIEPGQPFVGGTCCGPYPETIDNGNPPISSEGWRGWVFPIPSPGEKPRVVPPAN